MPVKGRSFQRLLPAVGKELAALSWEGPTAGLAFRAALGATLAMLAALALNLEQPVWAGITAFGMLQQNVAATLSRSFDRAIGTIAGAVLGYVTVLSLTDHLLFEIITAVVITFTVYGQSRVRHSYAVMLCGVTSLLVMFGSLDNPEAPISLAVYRALEILVGVAVVSAVDILFAPDMGQRAETPQKPGIFEPPVDVDLLVIALSAGLAIACVPAIWEGLQLPALGQTPVTAFVVVMALQKDPHWTALNRIFGCFVGGCAGLVFVKLVDDAFLPWVLLLFLGLYVCGFIMQRKGEAYYVGHQAGIALMMAMVIGAAPSPDITPAIGRLCGIAGGIVLVAVFHNLFGPVFRALILRLMARHARHQG
ncbi:FUSC family protein [Xanthobacteraceae bacterium A53D]